ncbi:MAG TPA: NUDIX hydrolase [Opitutaceae bacterium]
MKRAPFLALIRAYVPVDHDDAVSRGRFAAFVSTQPDCFERELEIGHVTASAWIVDSTGTRVLLTHHRKLDIWVQPGGHADGDADTMEVARREAIEETGLAGLTRCGDGIFDLDIHPIPARGPVPAHEHYDVRFAFRTTDSEEFVVSDESHDLAWVPLDQLEKYTCERSMLRMRDKWLRHLASAVI